MRQIIISVIIATGVNAMSPRAQSIEQAYPMTAVDVVEIKELPEARLMVAQTTGAYFAKDNNLFMRLFHYISSNEVAMTTPVEAELQPAQMRFYVGPAAKDKELKDSREVTIVKQPKRTVAAIGGRGAYTETNITAAREQLEAWLKSQKDYVKDGEPYAVFWNSPFTLWFLKRFEVHITVKPKKTGSAITGR